MSKRVLIVDDSLTVRMDLADAFQDAGFETVLCATAAEYRVAMSQGDVDAVILDNLLPDGDGIDLLREIRSMPNGGDTAVVMLSAESEVQNRIRGMQTGADEYVGKPYDAGYVVARMRELLRARRPSPSDSPTVLVIDDSATFRHALQSALEGANYTVMTAATGEEGLRLAAAQRPSAILVDGVLPGISGATVIRRIRLDAALRDVPCLLITASRDVDAELHALDGGADSFVHKDDQMDVILARLTAVMRRASQPVPPSDTRSLLAPKRILAVDDSATYLDAIASVLRDEGYDVICARSGEEAIEILGVQSVDCILLDLLMPGLSGQETCLRIKSATTFRDVPLIMLTALDDREAMIHGLSAGADDYISKSNELEVLKARVRAQLRRKQFEDENRHIREELLRSELKAAEARSAQELAATRAALVDELERKNRELEAFSYSVSHDLRAPLRSIDGFSQALIEDYADRLDPKGHNYLQRVRAAAQRMGELIDDLLELSRVGRAELSFTPVDLSEIARQVVAELQRADPDRQVSMAIEEGLIADADSRLMRVALENLFGNAWKFTTQAAAPHIIFRCEDTEHGPAFVVRDNGAGFDMSYAAKLFRPFQRLHGATEFPGTGIGLATVHRIIDRHGGRVWADGAVGRGAAISFSMPQQRSGGRA
jgi:two-component system, NtrC family, sensor kinase